jgi:hypothetical protein
MLTILNVMSQFRLKDGSFDLAGFKIVYVAPMKALVQEVFEVSVAQAASKTHSGVRARWVELPDCDNTGPLEAGDIALKSDLSNAIIATCKSYTYDPNA